MAHTTPHLDVDLLVVGFGKAGKTLARARAEAGDRVALVERSPQMYGGTCINIACVPTKRLLVESGRGVDFPHARAGRDEFIAALNAANKQMVVGAGVLLIDGQAQLLSPHRVAVRGDDAAVSCEINATTVVINTGATPVELDDATLDTWRSHGLIPGHTCAPLVDSTTIQQLEHTPERLVIIGAGPIGLEFATIFSQFGSQVTVINKHPRIMPQLDATIAAELTAHLESSGIDFVHDTTAAAAATVPALRTADAILVALGRRPATAGLGLAEVGIAVGSRGEVLVDDFCQTSVPGVYAAGDVSGGPQLTSVSYDDYRIIADHAYGKQLRRRSERLIPQTIFLNPPLSSVGLSADQAREQGYEVEERSAAIADLAVVPRPKIVKNPVGRASFVLDAATGLILGATLWCVDSQELINTVALAIRSGISARELGDGIYTHPSSSEIFNALLV